MSAILLSIVVLLAAAGIAFVNQRSFGRLPRGERLERIRRSPNYRDGQFRNLHPTPQMTSDKGFAGSMWGILFGSKERREPASALPVLKPDLHRLERAEDALVWFGHSSYLLQLDGVRLLVDPVLTDKWPMSLFFSPFKGTDVFSPEDMPDVDCLIVTHDHWDHLDYRTVMQLKERIGRVVCPLGVGEHFEYWGFDSDRIVELDWNESCGLSDGFPDPLPACAPFFRARVAAQPFALGLVFSGEPFAAGLSCRRRWLRCALRRDRPPVRADRPGGGGERAVQRRLALHSSDARKIAGCDPRPAPGTCADGASLEIRAEPPCVGRTAEKRRRSGGRRRVRAVATDDRRDRAAGRYRQALRGMVARDRLIDRIIDN